MGISGLLPFVRKAWREASLAEFAGSTVAVDIYCWMHKGAFACAEALALGQPTEQYVQYCLRLVRLLLRFQLKPILVFDGKRLPAKADTEEKRREHRDSHRRRAARLLAEGRKAEARECFERSINVTPEMAHRVIAAARELNVDCLVAPYESDAQLACLCHQEGIADLALSEDSDLLPFGCERVFFKLDLSSGRGILIERSRLLAEACPASGGGLSSDRFRHMCLLAGCDYHPGIAGVGLTTAAKVMARTRLGDLATLLSKLRMYLPRVEQLMAHEITALMRAEYTFLHQVVFDPLIRRQRPLSPYPANREAKEFAFAGSVESDDLHALQLALANVNFETGKSVGNFDPVSSWAKQGPSTPAHLLSIFDPRYRPRSLAKRLYKTSDDLQVEQTAPEALTGREKIVTVKYRLPKLLASATDSSLEKKSKASTDSSESTELLSQYFQNAAPIDDQQIGGRDDCDQHTNSTSPKSPVFNRSSNCFAVSTESGQSLKRARFSLDDGLCSPPTTSASISSNQSTKSTAGSPASKRTFLSEIFPEEDLTTFVPTTPSPRKDPSTQQRRCTTSLSKKRTYPTPSSPSSEEIHFGHASSSPRTTLSPKQVDSDTNPNSSTGSVHSKDRLSAEVTAKARVSGLRSSKKSRSSQKENKGGPSVKPNVTILSMFAKLEQRPKLHFDKVTD